MKFTFEEKEYRIKFRHQLPTSKLVKVQGMAYQQGCDYHNEQEIKIPRKRLWIEHLVPGWTLCTIQPHNLDGTWGDIDFDSAHSAYAYQSKKDKWSKEMGRQVSLGKTLKECDPEFAKAAWQAYNNRNKGTLHAPRSLVS